MNQYEREFFISRIVSGYLRIRINDSILRVYGPSIDTMYEANEIYLSTIKEAEANHCLSDDDILEMMYLKNLWTKEEDEELEVTLPKHLEWWKCELYNNYEDEKERDRIKLYLDKVKTSISALFNKKHSFDYMTCHGTAIFARWQHIIEKSTYTENKKKCDWNKYNIMSVMDQINKNNMTDSIIREIARTDPWRTTWMSAKKGKTRIFKRAGTDMTDDQKRLISWSSLYENVLDSPDCPNKLIIEDDDAFDGWLIIQNKAREKENERKSTMNKVSRAKNVEGAEMFYVASDTDKNALFRTSDIDKIYNLNDPSSRNVVKQRLSLIQERGSVSEHELPDIILDRRLAGTNASRTNNGK